MVSKARIIYNVPESVTSDLALADSSVSIHMGTKVGFGIIEVECQDLFHPDQGIDLADGRIPAFGTANVVSSGEEVSCVQANRQALRFLYGVVDGAEVADFRAETGALSGGVFQ